MAKSAVAKVISFDCDGTLTDMSFADSVWLEGIPRHYASKFNISVEDAKLRVRSEYDKIGNEKLEWYNPTYWIEKFGLNLAINEILEPFKDRIRTFPDVLDTLRELKKRYRLIVTTNARREFVELELEKIGFRDHFEQIFSATSDFGLTKNNPDLFGKICKATEVLPNEMVHVGDDFIFDFKVPTKLGINAFYLDRTGRQLGANVVHNLKEFTNFIIKSWT